MNSPSLSRLLPLLSAAALLAAAVASSAHAQAVAPEPPSDIVPPADVTAPVTITAPALQEADAGKVVVLDPFTVDAGTDVGYVAVDSLAGGRANLPLRVTPAPISSLTRAFIDDVQLTNVKDALRWTAGAVPQNWRGGRSGSGSQFNSWAFSVRGQGDLDQGGNPPSRNYFPNYVAQDLYNVDRVEAARGPNSILFGVGDIGGSIATYTKVPRLDRDMSSTSVAFNSNGGIRGTIDVNHVVSPKFAVRTNALIENERGWRSGDNAKAYALDLAMIYQISENSKFRLEVEGYDRKNNLYVFTLQDSYSLWDKTTSAAAWGDTIADAEKNPLTNPGGAPGVKKMTGWGPTDLVWIPSLASEGIMDWHNGYRSMGTNDVMWGAYLQPDPYKFLPSGTTIPALPSRNFTVAPSDGYLRARYAAITATFDQKINDNMEFQLAAYGYADSQRSTNFENASGSALDLNQQLPNGKPNPNYGKHYSELFLSQQNQFHPAMEFRGQLNYHFDARPFNIPLTEWISVSAGYRRTELKPRTYLAFDQPGIGSDNWIEHMIWGRLYWDDPHATMDLPSSVGGKSVSYQAMPYNWFDFDLRETIKYAGIVSQSRFWNDRLNITLGARRDQYKNYKVGIRGLDNRPTEANESGTTLQGGVIGYVLPWLGLTYNYSENFAPLAGGVAPTLYGAPIGAAKGKGQTLGLRISTTDGKYYASASYYKDKSIGRPKGGPGFQGVWNRYLDAGGTKTDLGPSGVITGSGLSANASMNFSDTTDLESHGYEFEFVGNPTRNIRLQANYSIPKSELSNSIPDSIKYYNQHLPDWQATANEPSADPTIQAQRVLLVSDLANLKRDIDGLSGTSINGHLIKSTFSFFGTYTFTETVLKGFAVGAGVSTLGKQYGNPSDVVNGERILSPGYSVYNAMLSYSRTIHSMGREWHAKFQLNVDNVLDKDTLIYRSYQSSIAGEVQGMDYDFIEPRKYTLTATFAF